MGLQNRNRLTLLAVILIIGTGLSAGCNSRTSGNSEWVLQDIESTGTTIVLQSTSKMTKADARNFCESLGYRLPTVTELKAISDLYEEGGWLDDLLIHERFWAEEDVDENNSFFVRLATGSVDYTNQTITTCGVLCMEGTRPDPPPPDNSGAGDLFTKAVALGTAVADIPGVKVLAPPIVSFIAKQAGLDSYTEQMNEISAKLDDIKNQLTAIEKLIANSTNELKNVMKGVKDTVIREASLTRESILYPEEATMVIDEAFRKFQTAILDQDPVMLEAAANQIILAEKSILYHLKAIYNRLVPSSAGSVPLLSNFESYLEYTDNDFNTSYELIEDYFTSLVEYQHLAFTLYLYFTSSDQPSRQNEINRFAGYLADQAGRSSLGFDSATFSHNVFRLVINHLTPNRASDPSQELISMHPTGAHEALKKTEFIRRSLAGENQNGLFGAVILTGDLNSGGITVTATHKSTRKVYTNPTMESYVMEGPVYDHRYASTAGEPALNIKPGTDYEVVTYAFENVPSGDYMVKVSLKQPGYPKGQYITESDSETFIGEGTAIVQTYDGNYNQTNAAGTTVRYGYGLLSFRVLNRYTEKSTLFQDQSYDYVNIKSFGNANNWPMGIEYSKTSSSPFAPKEGSGKRELKAHFICSEVNDQNLFIDFKVDVTLRSGEIGKSFAVPTPGNPYTGFSSTMHFYAGIYDNTDKKRDPDNQVHKERGHEQTGNLLAFYTSREENYLISDTFSFKPEKGHEYYLYMYVRMDNGYHYTNGTINGVDYIQFRYGD